MIDLSNKILAEQCFLIVKFYWFKFWFEIIHCRIVDSNINAKTNRLNFSAILPLLGRYTKINISKQCLILLYAEKKFNKTTFVILIIIYKKMFQQFIFINQNIRRRVYFHEPPYNDQFCSVLIRSIFCISHDHRYLESNK